MSASGDFASGAKPKGAWGETTNANAEGESAIGERALEMSEGVKQNGRRVLVACRRPVHY